MKKYLPKKSLRSLLLGFGLTFGAGIFDSLVQILALSRQEQLAEILRSKNSRSIGLSPAKNMRVIYPHRMNLWKV